MMKKLLASAALASLTVSSISGADTALIEPHILAQIEAGQPMEMEYNIKASAWVLILPITGKANFRVTMNKDTYAIKSKVKTTGLADILGNYDLEIAASGYTTTGASGAGTLTPRVLRRHQSAARECVSA